MLCCMADGRKGPRLSVTAAFCVAVKQACNRLLAEVEGKPEPAEQLSSPHDAEQLACYSEPLLSTGQSACGQHSAAGPCPAGTHREIVERTTFSDMQRKYCIESAGFSGRCSRTCLHTHIAAGMVEGPMTSSTLL